MAIVTETIGTIENTETGEITELVAYAPETPEDLAALLNMTEEELAEAKARHNL